MIKRIQLLIMCALVGIGNCFLIAAPKEIDSQGEHDFYHVLGGRKADEISGLRALFASHKDDYIGDNITLLLAENAISLNRSADAIEKLKGLAQNKQSVVIIWLSVKWGGCTAGDATPLVEDLRSHYTSNRDLVSDRAYWLLADAYLNLGEKQKAWNALESLRKKYPQGDRVEADLKKRMLAANNFAKTGNKAAADYIVRPDTKDGTRCAEILELVRRPHMKGLVKQVDICIEGSQYPEQKDVLAKEKDLVSTCKQLLELYGEFLSREELLKYTAKGLEGVRKLQPQASPGETAQLKEAEAAFSKWAEKIKKEQPARWPLSETDKQLIEEYKKWQRTRKPAEQ